jgi:CDP-glucose 4,6-dehydratase
MQNLFNNTFENKRVLITGDSGFKGSWLAIWLLEMGAEVYGYSLPPRTLRDNFVRCSLKERLYHVDGDIRDKEKLHNFISDSKPEIVFHLAAQPIVLESYSNPHYTYETNIMGTVNLFESVRTIESIKAVLNITSDKCYQNNEWVWGYRESDPLGGKDPYSASKACSELISASYLESFFSRSKTANIATARAGNVIGGGDWGENRIVPDFFRAVQNNEILMIRNPYSTRPWQYVLEPLSGYLELAARLFSDGKEYSGSWNFGPSGESSISVLELIREMQNEFGRGGYRILEEVSGKQEAGMLSLDISKARDLLCWKPALKRKETVTFTVRGYIDETEGENLYAKRVTQIEQYVELAKGKMCKWAL